MAARWRLGRHVCCEYPLGLDAAESRELARAAEAAGVHAAIGLQARANPAVRRARALLSAGAIGRVLTAGMVSTTAGFGPDTDPAVACTEDPASGVTVLTIQAAHSMDLAMALLGGVAGFSALATIQFPHVRIGGGAPRATPRSAAGASWTLPALAAGRHRPCARPVAGRTAGVFF